MDIIHYNQTQYHFPKILNIINPGAKERLVQITGPTEDKIVYAKQLMEETIKRNASPIRSEIFDQERLGSNSSLNSSASEDSSKFGSLNETSKRTTLLHSFSTSDATIGEYKYTVTIGEENLKITGTNPDLVTIAKLVLDEYFMVGSNELLFESACGDGTHFFDQICITENEDDNLKDSLSPSPFLVPSSSYKESQLDIRVTKISDTEKYKEEDNLSFNKNSSFVQELNNVKSNGDLKSSKENFKKSGGNISNLDISNKPTKIYSCEELIFLADSQLSRRIPEDWARISKEFPAVIKKLPIDWFSSKTYLRERPQESDAEFSIKNVAEGVSSDLE